MIWGKQTVYETKKMLAILIAAFFVISVATTSVYAAKPFGSSSELSGSSEPLSHDSHDSHGDYDGWDHDSCQDHGDPGPWNH